MLTSSRRSLLCTAALLVAAATSQSEGEFGFLFAANAGALTGKNEGDLAEALRGACATGHPVRLVVDAPALARTLRPPCDRVDVVALRGGGTRGAETGGAAALAAARRFKLEAIVAGLAEGFPGGTLYLDNDVAIRANSAGELSAVFAAILRAGKAFGLSEAQRRLPERHRAGDVPDGFAERNGGVVFFGDAERSRRLAADWLAEFARPSRDGHDQPALRRVLWRRRDELYDVPGGIQCRGLRLDEAGVRRPKRRSCDPCERDAAGHRPLLWHDHQPTLRENAARHALLSNGSLCGFAVAAPPGRPGSG